MSAAGRTWAKQEIYFVIRNSVFSSENLLTTAGLFVMSKGGKKVLEMLYSFLILQAMGWNIQAI